MKKSTLRILPVIFCLSSATYASSIILDDDFESYTGIGSSMNGVGGWTVVNGATPTSPTDNVAALSDYYWPGGGVQSVVIGGFDPTTPGATTMSHAVGVPFASLVPASPTQASFEFSILDSSPMLARNSYKFTLGSTAGALLTIDLTPAAYGTYNVTWGGLIASGSGTLAENVTSGFTLFTTDDGAGNTNYTLYNAGAIAATGNIAVASTNTITSFEAMVTNATGADGSVNFDNVVVVPEPSSALLLALSALGLLRRKR